MASIKKRTLTTGEVRYDVRARTGDTAPSRTFTSYEDARDYRNQLEADELRGLVRNRRGGDQRFGDYAERWLETRLVKGRPLSPATVQGYRGLLHRNIFPAFAYTRLRAVDGPRVREWYAKVATDAGQDQAAKSYRLLHAIFTTAVEDDLLPGGNPCHLRGAGQERAAERPVPENVADVLALVEAMEPRYRIVALLAGLVGLRTGESLGLRRQDVDQLRGCIHVRQTSQHVTGHGRITKEPKSEAGARTLDVPPQVISALLDHIATYGCAATGEIVTSPTGLPARRASISMAWRAAKDAVGADPRMVLHDLRHHALTLAARRPGTTNKELMTRGGHSSMRAAIRYQHASRERDRAIADFLGEQIAAATQSAQNVPAEASITPLRPR